MNLSAEAETRAVLLEMRAIPTLVGYIVEGAIGKVILDSKFYLHPDFFFFFFFSFPDHILLIIREYECMF